MHWAPPVHTSPFALSAQLCAPLVPGHVKGATQSGSLAQAVRHAFVPHTYGEQLDDDAVAQAPVPVQCETGVKLEPVHEAAPHDTPTPACSHAPEPLQLPVLPQGGLPAHAPWSAAPPDGMFLHEPANPGIAHD